ncbi:MAG: hypothetical protein BWZ01_00192 [Deltaproteobacteria bacterium ADurb.BinA179]|jgi:hypothetical protein|nr:MAG: hypothetical protein BWZ01_00192 [Deltaproteobacteria bacterium ADurb.BinA179]
MKTSLEAEHGTGPSGSCRACGAAFVLRGRNTMFY